MGRPKVERVVKQCAGCGKEVERRVTQLAKQKTDRVFCSHACRNRVGAKPVTIEERPCLVCGTVFRPLQRAVAGKYCSRECHNAAQTKRVAATCEQCGTEFERRPSQMEGSRRAGRFCSQECARLGSIRRPLDRMHNGKPARLNEDGYVFVWEPDHPSSSVHGGWVAEHRLVAEQMIGRPLTSDDEVHHVNRMKDDNRPENLEVLDGDTHMVITQAQRRSDRELLAEYIRRYGPLED